MTKTTKLTCVLAGALLAAALTLSLISPRQGPSRFSGVVDSVHYFLKNGKWKPKPKLNKCLDNLLRIDIAIMNWAIEEEKTTNDVPTWDDLRRNLEEDERLEKLNGVPFCPTGGTYKLGGVGEGTKCSKHRQ